MPRTPKIELNLAFLKIKLDFEEEGKHCSVKVLLAYITQLKSTDIKQHLRP